MTRQDIINELKGIEGVRIRFYKKSPYQVKRYKPEYVKAEAWIYTRTCQFGYLIGEESFDNAEYRKQFFDMIREEVQGGQTHARTD